MTLKLILTRHAKSSWDGPALDDHARPLNARGRKAAAALGDWLAARDHRPEEVLCSDARRARETWKLIASQLPVAPEATRLPGLYLASAGEMLGLLRGAKAPTLMMIGHNPGIGALAEALVEAPPADPRFARYPTGATSVIGFEAPDWRAVGARAGQLIDFVVPRDLTG